MKKIFVIVTAILIVQTGCNKKSTGAAEEALSPTAEFRITNPVYDGVLLEGNILDISNTSLNGNKYLWDFGNGITSTKAIPDDVFYVPCGGQYDISLTVTNKNGVSATSKQHVFIMCRGRMAHNSSGASSTPDHLRGNDVQRYVNNMLHL